MKLITKGRLTKVALALAVAGYCSIPALAAPEGNLKAGNWQIVTETTGAINGTFPWITTEAVAAGTLKTADTHSDHVRVSIDYGTRQISDTDPGSKQFHIGDTVSIAWDLGDTEGDTDTNNTKTKASIQWMSYSDQNGSDGKEIGTKGDDSYQIQESDADRYIGVKITPETETGVPANGTELILLDLSSLAGGGSDNDEIPTGPVVDDNVKVAIYKEGSSVNLLGNTSTTLETNATYKVLLWKDTNGNNKYDSGTDTDVTNNYNYRWKFTGNSGVAGTSSAGIINSNWDDKDLVIPVTNAEAKTAFEGAGATIGTDGVQGFGLSIDYKRK